MYQRLLYADVSSFVVGADASGCVCRRSTAAGCGICHRQSRYLFRQRNRHRQSPAAPACRRGHHRRRHVTSRNDRFVGTFPHRFIDAGKVPPRRLSSLSRFAEPGHRNERNDGASRGRERAHLRRSVGRVADTGDLSRWHRRFVLGAAGQGRRRRYWRADPVGPGNGLMDRLRLRQEDSRTRESPAEARDKDELRRRVPSLWPAGGSGRGGDRGKR